MNKTCVLWVSHEGNVSGANIAMLEFILKLNSYYEFIIIIPSLGSFCDLLKKNNIKYLLIASYSWGLPSKPIIGFNTIKILVRTIIAIFKLCTYVFKFKINIIFTNTELPVIGAIAAKLTGKKHIWWIHEFGSEHFGYKIGWGNQKLAYKIMDITTDLIICMSDALSDKYKTRVNTKVIRIYQPVSWPLLDNNNITKLGKYLIFGQISRSKGHLEVLKVLKVYIQEFPNQAGNILQIAGPCNDPEYLQELLDFIELNFLNNTVIINVGFVSKQAIIPKFDVLILASNWEGFGRVIIEANKAGLKVIVKNSGGAPELINYSNGIIYNDDNDLLNILRTDLKHNHTPIKLVYDENDEIIRLLNSLSLIII